MTLEPSQTQGTCVSYFKSRWKVIREKHSSEFWQLQPKETVVVGRIKRDNGEKHRDRKQEIKSSSNSFLKIMIIRLLCLSILAIFIFFLVMFGKWKEIK